jgi:drug/metabolite transporter (DMT)-like permease
MVISFAASVVFARAKPDVPTTEASTLGTTMVGLVSAPFALFHVSMPDFVLLAAFGIGQMGLALILFAAGVRLIPAADAGMIAVLESILGPILVWVTGGETPGFATLCGGAIVIIAVLAGTLLPQQGHGNSGSQ